MRSGYIRPSLDFPLRYMGEFGFESSETAITYSGIARLGVFRLYFAVDDVFTGHAADYRWFGLPLRCLSSGGEG